MPALRQYWMDPIYQNKFISPPLQDTLDLLAENLEENDTLQVFSDIAGKSFGLPAGTAIVSPIDDAELFPFLLRDPGCGMLLFKIDFTQNPPSGWEHNLGPKLNTLINDTLQDPIQKQAFITGLPNLHDILHHGLSSLDTNLPRQSYTPPTVDREIVTLTDAEYQCLGNDLLTLTNTLEIRRAKTTGNCSSDIPDDAIIGFIHMGSDAFPEILMERFLDNILNLEQNDAIPRLDLCATPLYSPLGQEFFHWINAAMNYARVNRYLLFQAVKLIIEETLPCKLSIINDKYHAGIFVENHGGDTYLKSTRGIQTMSAASLNPLNDISLIAGQLESSAALVTPGPNAHHAFDSVSHGISYNSKLPIDITSHRYYHAHNFLSYTNATTQDDKHFAYSFNLLNTLDHLECKGLVTTTHMLNPLINIHSKQLAPHHQAQTQPHTGDKK